MVQVSNQVKLSAPPKGAMIAIKIARIGEFKDEYEEFFLLAYEDKLQKHGEPYARRWAYRHAAKTVFFAVVEWSKLILVLYSKFAGR
jgi:hypothetical protein